MSNLVESDSLFPNIINVSSQAVFILKLSSHLLRMFQYNKIYLFQLLVFKYHVVFWFKITSINILITIKWIIKTQTSLIL